MGGCYLQSWLTGSCKKTGPPTATQFLEVWASNQPSDVAHGWQAYVSFDTGSLGYNHANSAGDARCVHAGVITEQTDVLPENIFTAMPYERAGETDPCELADKLALTIRVPDSLPHTPDRLMAFLYEDKKWRFPPAGPPDGGTDYNVAMHPQFDADGTIVMLLPGCTYYRESVLSGEYRIYVQLLMEERRPPMVGAHDYFWGSTSEVFSMPLDQQAHHGSVQPVEILLWPVVRQQPVP
jgi:hypothetical protein